MLSHAAKVLQERFGDVSNDDKLPCCFCFPLDKKIKFCSDFYAPKRQENYTHCDIDCQCPDEKSEEPRKNHVSLSCDAEKKRPSFGSNNPSSPSLRNSGNVKSSLVQSREEKEVLQKLWLEQIQNQTEKTLHKQEKAEKTTYFLDQTTGKSYRKGRLLGKGGFAKCYEVTETNSNAVFAGKVISKGCLNKPRQREKIIHEVALHQSLSHENVVAFHDYFEDESNVYFILEHCSRKGGWCNDMFLEGSLGEPDRFLHPNIAPIFPGIDRQLAMKSLDFILRKRRTLTESEVRYYMRQLVEGCRYIHSRHIIHRDLKLGNMLLNGNMKMKIADFGLATRVAYKGEKKTAVCGTPNYIAPEVIKQKGYSYEADIWSIGCIMYTMLCGRPPFETTSLKETYHRIKTNDYTIPAHVSRAAKDLITKLLVLDPSKRLALDRILYENFFTTGYAPASLPPSCCNIVPKFPVTSLLPRPKSMGESSISSTVTTKSSSRVLSPDLKTRRLSISQIITKTCAEENKGVGQKYSTLGHQKKKLNSDVKEAASRKTRVCSVIDLYKMLAGCLECIQKDASPVPLASVPKQTCISKWVDYSNKYGFGFQLSDGNVGVLFNDSTRMVFVEKSGMLKYVDWSNKVSSFTSKSIPSHCKLKLSILLYFRRYMDENLRLEKEILSLPDAGDAKADSSDDAVFMKKWYRTEEAIIMQLSNGTVQVNFFDDHTKLILSLNDRDYVVSFVDTSRALVSYRLLHLYKQGCSADIATKLRSTRRMLDKLINFDEEAV